MRLINKKNILFLVLLLLMIIISSVFYFRKSESQIVLKSGKHFYKNGLIIEKGKTIIIEPGAELIMGRGSRIEIGGRIIARGTINEPIVFRGDDEYWRGIEIRGKLPVPDIDNFKYLFERENLESTDFFNKLENGNIFLNCVFKNLATNKTRDVSNRKKAVIEVNNSSIMVLQSRFEDVVHIGCVQVENSYLIARKNTINSRLIMKAFHAIRSAYVIDNNDIIPRRYEFQTWPDGHFGNISFGIVTNNNWEGLSDDAIDFTGSFGFVMGNAIKGTFDDGISLDNKSEGYIIENEIENVLENGLMISNQSRAIIIDNKSSKNDKGLFLRSGGVAYVKDLEILDNKIGIMMGSDIPLIITKKSFNEIKQKIAEVNIEDAKKIALYESDDVDGMEKFFNDSYYDFHDYKVLKKEINNSEEDFKAFDFLKKIMKTVDIELEEFDFSEVLKIMPEDERNRIMEYENFICFENISNLDNEKNNVLVEPYIFLKNISDFESRCLYAKDYFEFKDNVNNDIILNTANKKNYVKILLEKIVEMENKI